MKQLVLTGLGHEHDRPNAADLHRELIPEHDRATNIVV
jgi:hypothetical protein